MDNIIVSCSRMEVLNSVGNHRDFLQDFTGFLFILPIFIMLSIMFIFVVEIFKKR